MYLKQSIFFWEPNKGDINYDPDEILLPKKKLAYLTLISSFKNFLIFKYLYGFGSKKSNKCTS